jgi:uncharacterized protein (DUF1778 family)
MRIFRRERHEGRRPEQVNIRLSKEEKELLETVADSLDMGASTYVAIVALEKARKQLKANNTKKDKRKPK